jgi:hypothetical protein
MSKTAIATQPQRFLPRGNCPFEFPGESRTLFLLFTLDPRNPRVFSSFTCNPDRTLQLQRLGPI